MQTKAESDLNPTYRQAVRLLKRKHGATIDQLAERLQQKPIQARRMIDRLRSKGLPIKNVGACRFQAD